MAGIPRPAWLPDMIVAGPAFRFPRGRTVYQYGGVTSRSRLPTDSIGTFNLTLQNVAVGSVVRVEYAAGGGTVLVTTAATATVVLAVPAYAAGSAGNNLRVKVRKGSASPFYIPWETLVTAIAGYQSIYVSQIPDE